MPRDDLHLDLLPSEAASSDYPRPQRHRGRILPFAPFALCAALATAALACDDGTGPDPGPAISTLELLPIGYSLVPGETVAVPIHALDVAGDTVPRARIQWHSLDPDVVAVDSVGTVEAMAVGTAEVRASAGNVVHGITITVVAPTAPCTAPGTVHRAPVGGDATWTAEAGPHHVPDSLLVSGTLVIAPGATVCMGPGAILHVEGQNGATGLDARGTAQDPIVLTSRESGAAWGGIIARVPNETLGIALSHLRLEHSERGVAATETNLRVEHASFRDVQGTAVSIVAGSGEFLDTSFDSVGAAVFAAYATATLTRVEIRRAEGAAIVPHRGSLKLRGTRILDTRAIAIDLGSAFASSSPSRIVEANDVVITGGASYPFRGDAVAADLLADTTLGNRVTGNARDTLIITEAATANTELVIRAALPWRAPSGLAVGGSGRLLLEPGAALVVDHGTFGLSLGVPLVARGTAEAPVTLIATAASLEGRRAFLGGPAATPNVVEHADVRGMILVSDSAPLHVDASRFVEGAGIELRVPESYVRTTTIEGAADSAAIVVAASGVTVQDVAVLDALGHGIRVDSAGATIAGCTITGSAGDGILVRAATGVAIADCNLEQNTGVGVRNVDTAALDARFNWWGDPAGPTGPAGDGVAGPVQFVPFRLAPLAAAGSWPPAAARPAFVPIVKQPGR